MTTFKGVPLARLLAVLVALSTVAGACGSSPKAVPATTSRATTSSTPSSTSSTSTSTTTTSSTTTTTSSTTTTTVPTTTTTVPTTTTTPKPVRTLPGGYVPSATAPGFPATLRVSAARHFNPHALVLDRVTAAAVKPWVPYVVETPVRVTVHALLLSTTKLVPGSPVTVAAGDLATGRRHDALVVLVTSGVRYQRLVLVSHGVAVGVVTLPAHMRAGTWALAVEDLSRIRVGAKHRLTGRGLVDMALFNVG